MLIKIIPPYEPLNKSRYFKDDPMENMDGTLINLFIRLSRRKHIIIRLVLQHFLGQRPVLDEKYEMKPHHDRAEKAVWDLPDLRYLDLIRYDRLEMPLLLK